MPIYKRGKKYWYHFWFNGEHIQESTKQGNPRVARQMEAAHKTSLAKGEVGIRDRKQPPSLRTSPSGSLTRSRCDVPRNRLPSASTPRN